MHFSWILFSYQNASALIRICSVIHTTIPETIYLVLKLFISQARYSMQKFYTCKGLGQVLYMKSNLNCFNKLEISHTTDAITRTNWLLEPQSSDIQDYLRDRKQVTTKIQSAHQTVRSLTSSIRSCMVSIGFISAETP